ncbi:hypothetical protein [Hyphomonas jannaschiana]|uniref:Uncharacterized protein n=1 Tax=Hyphomonas jannaschiana VP2 TaxID=1280952 RepID=A0A059F7L0_9PROT|nr:hypothetical protein [Hyphomonas jannaschiana]KCZ86579.1 hypothetical protein HJA_15544 [Hyphomonas jannaschiana VP2]
MDNVKTIAQILISITALHGCEAITGFHGEEGNMTPRKVWADKGYSSTIHYALADEVVYDPDDFAATLAMMDLGDGAYVYVLRSATLTVSFPEDEEEIDGWLEFRSGTDGQIYVRWTGIEARKPAISNTLSATQARRIFKRASRVLQEDSAKAHQELTSPE